MKIPLSIWFVQIRGIDGGFWGKFHFFKIKTASKIPPAAKKYFIHKSIPFKRTRYIKNKTTKSKKLSRCCQFVQRRLPKLQLVRCTVRTEGIAHSVQHLLRKMHRQLLKSNKKKKRIIQDCALYFILHPADRQQVILLRRSPVLAKTPELLQAVHCHPLRAHHFHAL